LFTTPDPHNTYSPATGPFAQLTGLRTSCTDEPDGSISTNNCTKGFVESGLLVD